MPCLQTANIFLAQAEGSAWTASACDYQWTGGGLGVRDVVYLLWTSVSGPVHTVHVCALCMLINVQGAVCMALSVPALERERPADTSLCSCRQPA